MTIEKFERNLIKNFLLTAKVTLEVVEPQTLACLQLILTSVAELRGWLLS